jgi:hypothetical protein
MRIKRWWMVRWRWRGPALISRPTPPCATVFSLATKTIVDRPNSLAARAAMETGSTHDDPYRESIFLWCVFPIDKTN